MSPDGEKTGPGFTMTDPESAGRGAESKGELPKIDFSTFVLSMGTSALHHMGKVADPAAGAAAGEPNMLLARQVIDTLEMIVEKTRGNLSDEEAKLLESILYELHVKFVSD